MSAIAENYIGMIIQIYGLAFFVFGVVVFVLPSRDSTLNFAPFMGWLAAFGMLHGLLELTDGARLHNGAPGLYVLRSILSVSSFLALFEFGRRAWNVSGVPIRFQAFWSYTLIVAGVAFLTYWAIDPMYGLFAGMRWLVGAPGALLSAISLALIHTKSKQADKDLPPWLALAALALSAYSVLTLFISFADPRLAWLPTTNDFLAATSLPVQLFRAMCAVLASFSHMP